MSSLLLFKNCITVCPLCSPHKRPSAPFTFWLISSELTFCVCWYLDAVLFSVKVSSSPKKEFSRNLYLQFNSQWHSTLLQMFLRHKWRCLADLNITYVVWILIMLSQMKYKKETLSGEETFPVPDIFFSRKIRSSLVCKKCAVILQCGLFF